MQPFVSVGELARALGLTAKQVRYGADVGRFPGAIRGTSEGSHRRWPTPAAITIVRAAGRAVPESWDVDQQRAA